MNLDNWKRPISVAFDVELLKRIDNLRGHMPRSAYIRGLVKEIADIKEQEKFQN